LTTIRVVVQVDRFPGGQDIDVCIPLDAIRARETLQVLDFPGVSPGWICTDTAHIRKTMGARNAVARELTDAILKALGERDLIDGYPKEERKW
jgi:hypothetical protein